MKFSPKYVLGSIWILLPASVLMALLVSRGDLSLEAQIREPVERKADSAQFRTGDLDDEAVQLVTTFEDFPIVWLGAEFLGYRLTSVARTNTVTPADAYKPEIRDNRLSLVYGSCEREAGDWGCTPPLSIIIWAPDTIPGPSGVEPAAIRGEGTTRGLVSAIVSESTVLWTGDGIAIQVQANSDIHDEVIKALRLANADVLGLDEIGPTESLAPLRDVK